MKEQPSVNIGMVGHVDHGKTTLTQALSGKWTDTHSEELKRGISIKLGYADTTFYNCLKCKPPESYSVNTKCPVCGGKTEPLRKVSFVDAPGHETLMATMLSGAALMNGAILLIAANEECPQPQTQEHLMALQISEVENIIIVQNKIDLVNTERIKKNYEEIKEFVKGTIAENAPIIPVSAHHNANIDLLIQAIEDIILTPQLDPKAQPLMYIARSFDVNKPGALSKDLQGGIIGGSLVKGLIKVGQKIEVKPGIKIEEGGETKYEPLLTTITSLSAGNENFKEIKPGGLIGIGTNLDPVFTKSDGLIGRVAGNPSKLPPLWQNLTLEPHLLERAVGTNIDAKIENIKTNEPLLLTIGTATTVGVVTSAQKKVTEMKLKIPICAEKGHRVAISRRIGGKWRLIGYGIIC